MVSTAQDAEPRWRVLNRSARQAAQSRDYAKLREILIELQPLMPGSARIAYNLAAAEARLGNRTRALEGLANLAAMGLVYDFNAAEDFAALRGDAALTAILERVDRNRRPVAASRAAFPLSEPDLIPEDLAYDPATRRFFVSSVRKRKIVTADGATFATTDLSVFALALDTRRRLLWAATAWTPHCESCDPADKDKTALLAFDLATGERKRRLDAPVKGALGDMTLGPDGNLYVSEGLNGSLFRVHPDEPRWERLDTPGDLASPQTPALSADGRTLYVPDYLRGLAAIDLTTRAVRWLQPGPGVVLSGIDGLYFHRGALLAVQNGASPARIVRFPLDLKTQTILEANTTGLGEPTHGVFVGDEFHFIANSGWNEFDDQGKKKAGAAPVQSQVRKIAWQR